MHKPFRIWRGAILPIVLSVAVAASPVGAAGSDEKGASLPGGEASSDAPSVPLASDLNQLLDAADKDVGTLAKVSVAAPAAPIGGLDCRASRKHGRTLASRRLCGDQRDDSAEWGANDPRRLASGPRRECFADRREQVGGEHSGLQRALCQQTPGADRRPERLLPLVRRCVVGRSRRSLGGCGTDRGHPRAGGGGLGGECGQRDHQHYHQESRRDPSAMVQTGAAATNGGSRRLATAANSAPPVTTGSMARRSIAPPQCPRQKRPAMIGIKAEPGSAPIGAVLRPTS